MQAGDTIILQACSFCKNARLDIAYRKLNNELVPECYECSADRMNTVRELAIKHDDKVFELLDTENIDCTNCNRESPMFSYWFVDNEYHGFCVFCMNKMMFDALDECDKEVENDA